MIKTTDQLMESLNQEKILYHEILKLEKEKFEVIKTANLKELEKMTIKEQQYLMKMATFEKIRRSILTNAAKEIGVEELHSISDLLIHLKNSEMVQQIDDLRNQMLNVIAEIKEINELNEKLMNQHLDYINFNMELLTSNLQSTSNYSGNPTEKGKQKTNLFDARI
ncbi:flagellar protein FlgN [Alkaliphilus serpentinus]|uniref:Flagellar protein FlgN n=1 Tax=Alkaliphilus serpentinus TaxID=1482731 RepID=A0A833M920_9FIRM|nr:flagellar protein FlgN [Alkaliphilus serpentinus]KAB3526648.1 flagellar protein FlgN [Alkaliphilus serpentinus]